jgi:hypothetical protein
MSIPPIGEIASDFSVTGHESRFRLPLTRLQVRVTATLPASARHTSTFGHSTKFFGSKALDSSW